MSRAIVVLIVALAFLVVGPMLTSPRPKSAGTAFVYEPPEGFKPVRTTRFDEANAQVWSYEEPSMTPAMRGITPNPPQAVLTHSTKQMSVEEADLAKLADEMASAFEGCHWVHRRHELRTRADGARVGLIEGDCDHELDLSAFGLPAKTIKQRKMQLMFPDDEGTSIVTGSYLTEQASRWEPLFEATIGKAKGVATRTPAPPPWMYAAWGAAGLVLGWFASALVNRTDKRTDKEPNEPKAPAKEA